MSTFKKYLQERIESQQTQHDRLTEMQKEDGLDSKLSLAYNAMASSVWDIKCELELALAEYDRCHHETNNNQ